MFGLSLKVLSIACKVSNMCEMCHMHHCLTLQVYGCIALITFNPRLGVIVCATLFIVCLQNEAEVR